METLPTVPATPTLLALAIRGWPQIMLTNIPFVTLLDPTVKLYGVNQDMR